MATEFNGEALWVLLQENNIVVSEDWKAVLSATKYDSLALLAKLDDNDMDEIRKFMRLDYHKLLDEEEVKKIYGVYSRKPEIFELTGGLKKSIKDIVVGCDSLLTRLKRKRSFTSETDPTKIAKTASNSNNKKLLSSADQQKKVADLKTNIEDNIKDYCLRTVPEIADENGNIYVTATIKCIGDSKYTAEVPCPKADKKNPCDFVGSIHMNSHKNWNVSNFYKHCRTHIKKCTNQQLVTDFFRSTSKKNKKQSTEEDQEEEIHETPRIRKNRNTPVIIDSDEETEHVDGYTPDTRNPDSDVGTEHGTEEESSQVVSDKPSNDNNEDFQRAPQTKKKK